MLLATGWQYQNSVGKSISGGPLLEGVLGTIRLYLTSPENFRYRVNGVGVGIGVGKSAVPVTASFGMTDLPSWGSYLYTPDGRTLSIDDLSGIIIVYSADGNIAVGQASISFAVFIQMSTLEKAAFALTIFNRSPLQMVTDYFSDKGKAICWFGGFSGASPNLAADLTGVAYIVGSVTDWDTLDD